MKRLLTLIALVLITSVTPLFAQDVLPTEEAGVEAQSKVTEEILKTSDLFDVEIEVGTQSPWTKRVPVTIKFRATIDADQVGISWDTPEAIEVVEKHPQFISVIKGEVYTAKATVKSDRVGAYDIAGNVTAWQFNTNYTSSASTSLKFDEDGVTDPHTSGYAGAVIVRYIILVLLTIVGGALAVIGGKIGLKKLKIWLTPPT